MLIIRRSNCINTASGIVLCVSDCPVCRLRRNLHNGWSLTQNIIPERTRTPDGHLERILYQRDHAHRAATYREYYTREIMHTRRSLTENNPPERSCTPDGHLHRILYQRKLAHRTVTYREYYTRENRHTGRSLTHNTISDAVLIQFDLLMMSTELLETCTGLL